MDVVLKVIGQLVMAAGGVGVIILGLSAFIGKIWADIFMKKQISKYEKSINVELEKLKSNNLRLNYIITSLHDDEMKAIKELSALQINFVDEIVLLFRNRKEFVPDIKQKQLAKAAYTCFSTALLKNAPFIEEKLYEKLSAFRTKGHALLILHDIYESGIVSSPDVKKAYAQADELIADSNNLRNTLREYVNSKKKELEDVING